MKKIYLLKVCFGDDCTFSCNETIGVFDDETKVIEAEEKYKIDFPDSDVYIEEAEMNTIFE